MTRMISQRELRNQSGAIMRALDRGETFVVTRNGVPVGELAPAPRRCFVATESLQTALSSAPRIDAAQFRGDLDAGIDQDPTPRG